MQRSLQTLLALTILSPALAACDPQATPGYNGDSLLTLKGVITGDRPKSDDRPQPMLAFYSESEETGAIAVHATELAVEEEFPNAFTLRFHAPPPDSALLRRPDMPAVALGFVVVARSDAPNELPRHDRRKYEHVCDEGGCEFRTAFCLGQRECFWETYHCPAEDSHHEECELIDQEGNELLKSPWLAFEGWAEGYTVAYLPEALPADHASLKGSDTRELAAGYHLIEQRSPRPEELLPASACATLAITNGIEAYNEDHDTDYTYWDYVCSEEEVSEPQQALRAIQELATALRGECLSENADTDCYDTAEARRFSATTLSTTPTTRSRAFPRTPARHPAS